MWHLWHPEGVNARTRKAAKSSDKRKMYLLYRIPNVQFLMNTANTLYNT